MMTSQLRWLSVRKELYEQIRAQVRLTTGVEDKSLQRYSGSYEKIFTHKAESAKLEDLAQLILSHKIIFIGDFHAVRQSQKGLVRLLGSLPKDLKFCLAVEFIESKQQKILDRYMSGQISEKDFLKKIKWDQYWGFPWEHYRIILRFCLENKITVLALNMSFKNRKASSLLARDKYSAAIIADKFNKNNQEKIIVFYGDWHLAPGHLPRQVKQLTGSDDFAFIYQNSEKLYFQLMEEGLESQVDIVRIDKNAYCILNIPPWVKWQNYLVFLENKIDRLIEDEDAELIDYTDHVQKYYDLLQKDFNLTPTRGTFSVYTVEEPSLWDQLRKNLKPNDLKWCEGLIETGNSFYIPQLQLAYLGKPSVNQAASLAMLVLISQLADLQRLLSHFPDDFERLIWFECLRFLGSKMVNPKRKSDSVHDLRFRLGSKNIDEKEREALRLALGQKTSELLFLSRGQKVKHAFKPTKKIVYQIAARLLGSMMGEKIFFALQQGILQTEVLFSLIKKPVQSENFKNIYYEIVEMVESYPEPFRTKKEKL